ncbi:unnamed protein product [Symbiodinium pilosum]|uniref:Uncharacterized protein n=1 Tax=Symbiodinium pilosum TaxID=2952 RepID=A0A812V2I1_SYMPI|nr:unnamed protein product [Symbiodinium pilosum]
MLAQSSKDSLAAESGSKEFTLEETQLTPTPASKGKGHGAKDLGKQNLAPTQARIPPGQPDATPTRVAPSTRPARNPATRLPRPPLTPSSIVTSQKAPSEASKEPKKEGYWKVRRYVTPNQQGVAKCSKDVLEMAQTVDGREKLRQLLLQHGSFEKVEVVVKQWHEQRKKNKSEGGYHTKQWLMDNRSFTQLRVNEVHGVEEADVPLDETWSNETERGRRIEFSGAAEMEVPRLTIFCVLCFPALQANVSASAILPNFLAVLGKKLDQGDAVKEKCQAAKSTKAIFNSLQNSLNALSQCYDDLVKLQSEAAIAHSDDLERIDKEIMVTFVQATKEDLALNNYVMRAKPLVYNCSQDFASNYDSHDLGSCYT